MASIIQHADGSADFDGYLNPRTGFVAISNKWNASSIDEVFFVASRRYVVRGLSARVETAGTDASAVTAVIKKAASGTAIGSGTALHSGSINLKGTAATTQALTKSTTASDLIIEAGDSIGIDYTGTLTAAVGVVTLQLSPA